MKLLFLIILLMPFYSFASPTTVVPEENKEFHEKNFVVDFHLIDFEDEEKNKQSSHEFLEFLIKHNYVASFKENTKDLEVRVIIDPPNEERYLWLIEHSKTYAVQDLYVYSTSDTSVEPVEVDIEKSGAIPLEYLEVVLEDKRRLEPLLNTVQKTFEKNVKTVGDLEYIASIDLIDTDSGPRYGVTIDVRNSQKNFLQLMKILADFKTPMLVRDYQDRAIVFDVEKYRAMAKKKLPITYSDFVATEATSHVCEQLFIL
jgi:hypothetical protein